MQILSQPNIWITLDKISHTLGWKIDDVCDRLQLSEKQFLHQKSINLSPSLSAITHLTESIHISIDAVVTGKIDYKTLRAHFNGDLKAIPERYSIAKFSKIRTSTHILDFVEKHLGWDAKKSIYNHFQINEAIVENDEEMVNFLLPSDICRYVGEKFKAPEIYLEKIGAHSAVVNKNSIVGKIVSTYESPKELYENMFTEAVHRLYDKNQTYRILKLTDQYCIVEPSFREEVKDLLQLKTPGNRFACHSIAGSISSLTGYMDLPYSKVTKIDCVHKGGCSCKYKIDFPLINQRIKLSKAYRPSILQ
jgi:hypothetical protein